MNHEDTFTSHSDALQPTTSSNMNVGSSRDKSTVSKDFTVDLTGAKCVVPKEENGEESSSNSSSEDEECCELSVPENFSASNTQVSVQNSNDVVVGPLTQFHGPVTIYQKTNNASEQVNNASPGIEGNGNIQLDIDALTTPSSSVFSKALLLKWALVAFLLLICTIIIFFAAFYASKRDTSEIERLPGGYAIVPRSTWGAAPPRAIRPLRNTPKYVVISHTAGATCTTFKRCGRVVSAIQSDLMNQKYSDIPYNFLIGGDHNVYEGRGWGLTNSLMDDSISISFLGNYVLTYLDEDMENAALQLMQKGVDIGKLQEDYIVVAHNQTWNTLSPGTNVYLKIKHWSHFNGSLLFTDTNGFT